MLTSRALAQHGFTAKQPSKKGTAILKAVPFSVISDRHQRLLCQEPPEQPDNMYSPNWLLGCFGPKSGPVFGGGLASGFDIRL